MKIISAKVLFLAGSMLSTCHSEVYKSTATMAWSIFVPNPTFLSIQDRFILEKKTEEFFTEKLASSSLFRDQQLYMTTFDIKSQSINPDLVQSKFDAEITILYEGKEKKDLSMALAAVIPNSEVEKLVQNLVMANVHFGVSSTSSTVEYIDIDSVFVASSSGNKTLFIALLSLVSVLILTSFGVLISSTKCCRRKGGNNDSESQQGIKHSSTMETAENSPSNSQAKLGAKKNVIPIHEESAYAITPVRRGRNSQVSQTPVSQHSSLSDLISPASSTASRNPLGIMRLSTLNKVTHQQPNEAVIPNTMYKIPLHESSDDEESAAAGKV